MPIPKRYISDQSTDQAATTSMTTAHAIKKIDTQNLDVEIFCGARGIRTPDLFHAMEARYQLRHSPFI